MTLRPSFRLVRIEWILLALVVAASIVARSRFSNVPLERDEGEYAYAGQLLLRGIPPYKHAYNMKLPGTYAAYALSEAVFGQTIFGVRMGLLIANAATTVLIFLLGKRFFGSQGGLVAALAFAFFSLQTEMLGPFGHATHFVVLAATAGILALLWALRSRRPGAYFAAGFLLGLAPLMKQPGVVFALFGACWLVWDQRSAGEPWRRTLRSLSLLLAGMSVPIIVTIVALAVSGAWHPFAFWVFAYASKYATEMSVSEGMDLLRGAMARIVPQAFVWWVIAALGLLFVVSRGERRERIFFVGLLGFSFVGTCAGLYFREHYFLLLLPPVSLLCGAALRWIPESLETTNPRAGAALVSAVLLIAAPQAIWSQRRVFLSRIGPDAISREIYGNNPFPEAVEVGRFLRERTLPSDRIVVFGSEPEVYFYSRRLGGTGYIYMYGLMEPQPFAARMQEEMIREVAASRPAYVVWVKVPASWLERPASSRRIIDWGADLVRDSYALAGQLVRTPDGMEAFWDERAFSRPLDASTSVLVFRRRDFRPPSNVPSTP